MKQFYNSSKVLVTGGLGFIGSTLSHRLVELGAEVTIVDSLFPNYGGNLFNISGIEQKVKIIKTDIRNKPQMLKAIEAKDYIFNLAGTLSHIDSMSNPFLDLEINCAAQLSLLEIVKQVCPNCKILFAGTRGQYGKARYLPVDELHPMYPTDVNGINNIAGEMYHILYNNVYGIRSCSLRLTNTYGPRHQMNHHKQGIINWFIRQIIDGEKVKIYGDGNQIRDVNYVDDVVNAMLIAMSNDNTNGECFNLGGIPISLKDIVIKMIDVYGKGEYELVPYTSVSNSIEVGDYRANFSKYSKLTGWKPCISVDDGLRKTFEYYSANRSNYWGQI